MTEKTVDQKLKECRTVIIQNVEKSIQNTMIYRYIKDEKLQNDVKKYVHNTKDGYITLEFNDHEKAKQYYDKANFKDKILIRPFNIYFNVQLNDNEMKKYHFEGANEDNMRKMFDIARKVGICKIYTSYTSQISSGKLKPTGVLSFVRKDPISEQQFQKLKQELSEIGVKINIYTPDKGLKCAVVLTDFFEGDLTDTEQNIEKNAKEQATNLMKKVLKDYSIISTITAIVKRRDVADAQSKEGLKTVTKVKALVEFTDYETAINNFEQIRKGFIDIPKGKATLNFYTSETNSYISLYTSGLIKPQGLSEKQFEDQLVDAYRKVNKDVVQANVYPSGTSYVARVYLKNEQSGRCFIADYSNYRDLLVKFYKSKDIKFNINIDDKTMKKIKQYEKKAVHIMAGIKNQGDRTKNMNRAPHHVPLHQYGMPPLPQMGGIMSMPQGGKMPMMGNIPPMPTQQGMNPPMGGGSQMGVPMQMGMPPSNMGMGGMMAPMMGGGMGQGLNKAPMNAVAETRAKIDKLWSQKAHILQSCQDPGFENTFRKQMYQNVKFVLQNDLKLDLTAASVQAGKIAQNNDIGLIVDFLKKPQDYYSKLNRS